MLRCVSPYRSDILKISVGETVDDPALESHLLADSPASFEAVDAVGVGEVVAEVVASPPVDKQIKTARKKA